MKNRHDFEKNTTPQFKQQKTLHNAKAIQIVKLLYAFWKRPCKINDNHQTPWFGSLRALILQHLPPIFTYVLS